MDYFLRLNFNLNYLITSLTYFKSPDIYCEVSFQKVVPINISTRKLYLRVLTFLNHVQQSPSGFYSIFSKNLGQCKKVKNKFLKFAFKTEPKLFLTYLLVICTPFCKMLFQIFYLFSPLGCFVFFFLNELMANNLA